MAKKAATIPISVVGYLKSWGPGIIVAMTWLGAGDIVDCSVSGAGWGYGLMWVLTLALLARFTFVGIIAKYQLCNPAGETIVAGYARLGRWVPLFIAVVTMLFAHLTNSYMAKGAGEVWHQITQKGSPMLWSALCCVFCVMITGRGIYRTVEKVMSVFLAIMTMMFLVAAMLVVPDLDSIATGIFTPQIPAGMSAFGTMIVVVSLIGGVGGSLTNLMYPYMIREKGWIGPQHRRVQTLDLFLSVIVIVVINMAVWIIAAEVLHPLGLKVESLADIAQGLKLTVGHFGKVVLYLGIFGAMFTSWVGVSLAMRIFLSTAFIMCGRTAPRDMAMSKKIRFIDRSSGLPLLLL